jgi:hypothetical protein
MCNLKKTTLAAFKLPDGELEKHIDEVLDHHAGRQKSRFGRARAANKTQVSTSIASQPPTRTKTYFPGGQVICWPWEGSDVDRAFPYGTTAMRGEDVRRPKRRLWFGFAIAAGLVFLILIISSMLGAGCASKAAQIFERTVH